MLSAIKAKLLGAESLFSIWVIQQLRGPIFNHLPPSSGQTWTFYVLPSLCSRDPCGFSTNRTMTDVFYETQKKDSESCMS